MPESLNRTQIDFYGDNGYLVLEKRVPGDIIDQIRAEIERFKEMARGMTASDDKIDLEDSHKPDDPVAHRRDAHQPAQAGTPPEPHQERFDVVVEMVGQGDPVCPVAEPDLLQPGVA